MGLYLHLYLCQLCWYSCFCSISYNSNPDPKWVNINPCIFSYKLKPKSKIPSKDRLNIDQFQKTRTLILSGTFCNLLCKIIQILKILKKKKSQNLSNMCKIYKERRPSLHRLHNNKKSMTLRPCQITLNPFLHTNKIFY